MANYPIGHNEELACGGSVAMAVDVSDMRQVTPPNGPFLQEKIYNNFTNAYCEYVLNRV